MPFTREVHDRLHNVAGMREAGRMGTGVSVREARRERR